MNPQQPPYQQYQQPQQYAPPQQSGRQPMPGFQPSGGYPYPQQPSGYQPPPGQAWPPPGPGSAPKKLRKWPWIAGVVVLLIIIIGSASNHPGAGTSTTPTVVNAAPAASQAQAAPPAPVAPAGPATSFSDGTYHVGADIVPGRYKTPGPSVDAIVKDCYWERTRDDSGQFGAIISNGNAVGPGYVTVKKGEFFQTSGGCTWTKQ